MNGAHLHIVLTHLPVLGVAFGAVLLAAGLWRQNRSMQRVALAGLVFAGLAAGAAYLTGEGAEGVMERVAESFIGPHEQAATIGLIVTALAGVGALALLIQGRRGRPFSRGLTVLTLVIALAASGTMAWVANLGGKIGHSEIRNGQSVTATAESEHGQER